MVLSYIHISIPLLFSPVSIPHYDRSLFLYPQGGKDTETGVKQVGQYWPDIKVDRSNFP